MCGGGVGAEKIFIEMRLRSDVFFSSETWSTDSSDAVKWLSEQCDWCPACMLSVLRQGKIFAFEVFDYKKSVAAWHAEKAEEIKELCGF